MNKNENIQGKSHFTARQKILALSAGFSVLAGCGGVYYYHHSRNNYPKHQKPKSGEQNDVKKTRKSGAGSNSLVKLCLKMASKQLLLYFGLSLIRTQLMNRQANLQGRLFKNAFLQSLGPFTRCLLENLTLCAVASIVESTSSHILSKTYLMIRSKLTKQLHNLYCSDMVYYRLSYVDRRIDNPEERICEDVPQFAEGLSNLMGECLKSVSDAAFYSYRLQSYTGTNVYTFALLGYVLVAGTLINLAQPNFSKMLKKQQAMEGEYRRLHERLQHNCESISLYRGVAKEGNAVVQHFRSLLKFCQKLLHLQFQFGIAQDFLLKYLGATLAVVLIIGPFFTGQLRHDNTALGRANMLRNMRYHTGVVLNLFSALGTLGGAARKLKRVNAHGSRVAELMKVMKEIKQKSASTSASSAMLESPDSIEFRQATVVTPGDATLITDLNLKVSAGTNLLVTGPNGAGKSSLFRVLGGLWPLQSGQISKPGANGSGLAQEIFYVPQRPYVTVGTLEEQLVYPLQPAGVNRISMERIRELLKLVELEYLLERDGWSPATNWGEILSLGEQQRLGMARLFFHSPRFAILDECTSGVTRYMEKRFCKQVAAMGCTCITISHRPTMVAYHDVILNLDGNGSWQIHQGERIQLLDEEEEEEEEQESDGSRQLSDDMDDFEEGNYKILAMSPPIEDRTATSHRPILGTPLPLPPRSVQNFKFIMELLLPRRNQTQILQVASIALIICGRTLLTDQIASLNGRSVTYVLKQDLPKFKQLIGVSVLQSTLSSILAPSLRYVTDALALTWRGRLTQVILDLYFQGDAFYASSQLMGLMDIDQRISRDVSQLCSGLAGLVTRAVKPILDVTWFSGQMIALTGYEGCLVLYLYIVVAFGLLRAVSPNFSYLVEKELYLEGQFRKLHSRLRLHAEQVAFFGGGNKELQTLSSQFDLLTKHLHKQVNVRWWHTAVNDFFGQQLPNNATWILTFMYSLRAGGKGALESVDRQGQLVHDMRYLASVVSNSFSAFGELMGLQKRLVELSGEVGRMQHTLQVLRGSQRPLRLVSSESSSLRAEDQELVFEGIDVTTPNGHILAHEISLRIKPGMNILITGPNGSGKTSLVRMLAGLWPNRIGNIINPDINSSSTQKQNPLIYYVPQKPYTSIGTLMEQVVYPQTIQGVLVFVEGESREQKMNALDSELVSIMQEVKLNHLLEREDRWDKVCDWTEILSLGEQQRLGMARLYFHKPVYGVLDECTNATSIDVEEDLYQGAERRGITLITVTQRTALQRFHQHELKLLDGEGSWVLRQIQQQQQEQTI